MSTLKQQAEELGITVNGRWSDETLQKKIDEAKASAKATGGASPEKAGTGANAEAAAHELQGRASGIDGKTRLTIVAEELGITVNEAWDEDRLRSEIQTTLAGRAEKSPEPAATGGATHGADGKAVYTLVSDYWDENGERIKAGTDLPFTDEQARRLGPNVLKPKSVFN